MLKNKVEKLKEEDFFKILDWNNDKLHGKTDLKLLYYGDAFHPKPEEFIKEITSEYYHFTSDVRGSKNYLFPISIAGYNSLRSILQYCKNKNWITYQVLKYGDVITYYNTEKRENLNYILTKDEKYIKIVNINTYEIDEFFKNIKSKKKEKFIQRFILVFSFLGALATILSII